MSYSISLAIKDGAVTVTGAGGQLPDGSVSISGHDDDVTSSVSVSVSRSKVAAS